MASEYADYLIDLAMYKDSDCDTMDVGSNILDFDWNPDDFEMNTQPSSGEGTYDSSDQTRSFAFSLRPRNDNTAILCGCQGRFSWEIIPTHYSEYYLKPHSVNTVDHTISTCKVLPLFSETLWEGFNFTSKHINKGCKTDYCLAIYQRHADNCYKHTTRYTIKSVINLVVCLQTLTMCPNQYAFCTCSCKTTPMTPFFCFTCLQLHLELKNVHIEQIEKHFSYQVILNPNFSKDIPRGVTSPNFFQAESLFHPGLAVTKKAASNYDFIFLHCWKKTIIKKSQVQTMFRDHAYCLMCNYPGNGTTPFVCQQCR